MKKRQGYSLGFEGDRPLVVKIETGTERPYRLAWVKNPADAGSDAEARLRELSNPRRRVALDLPNDHVHLMNSKLPPMPRKALAGAVQGIVTRKEGGRPGDWIADYQKLGTDPGMDGTGGDYAIVFADRALVEEAFEMAGPLGCRPGTILPNYLALEELFRRHGPEGRQNGAWNLVFLGAEERYLLVGDSAGLLFARPLPEDRSGEAGRADYLERLATEVERSNFFAQQAERSMVVRNIVVCGEPELADALTTHLRLHVDALVRRWQPESLFEAAGDDAPWQLTPHLGRAVAALHGPAVRLLPPGARSNPVKLVRRKVGIALAAFVTGAVSMLLTGGLLTSRVQQDYLAHAEVHVDRLYGLAAQASNDYLQNRSLRDRQDNVDRLGAGQPDLAAVLDDIASRTPREVVFDGLELGRDRRQALRLVLRGESTARTGEQAQRIFLEFLDDLGHSERLTEWKEPVFLEIAGVSDSRQPRSRVAFTLEYIVREETP